MLGEWQPVPEEQGQRVPPVRLPPTAVGVLTPEPEPEVYSSAPSLLLRVALGILHSILLPISLALVWSGGAVAVAGVMLLLNSVRQFLRAYYGEDLFVILRAWARQGRPNLRVHECEEEEPPALRSA